ncbi:MAG: energy transducer TonB [Allosphingosinicella sp.]
MKKCLVLAAAALPLQAQMAPPPPAPAPRIVVPARPRADPQSLIAVEDYPQAAIRSGEQGRVGFALDVGAELRVHGCSVTRSSGSAALDSATCRLIQSRARFTPAMDSNGRPVPSRVEEIVAWTLSDGRPAAPRVEQWGYGMVSNSVPAPAVVAVHEPRLFPEPVVAVPQDGPGEAELSVWDARTNAIADLGLYESIPACRKVKAELKLRAEQRAWCTVAREVVPDFVRH